MTFSVGDYEHSIARIFAQEGNVVVGTGFLIAPGYALTCAHVVLQAMGINEADFGTTPAPLKQIITLDFPVAGGVQIRAEVVAWQPYRIDQGDIAGLKLLAAAPAKSKPTPIVRYSLSDIQGDEHAVFGFANDNGDRTDAYKPKAHASGGRFQFYKAGNPADETIQAGYSGAPVWNDQRKCVIGMVATAMLDNKNQTSKAYAIPEESLSPVIQELFARSLYDSIRSYLEATGETARQRIRSAIESAFWLCDTDGDRATSEDLLNRLLYLLTLSNRTWKQHEQEIDRLTQFAMFLAVMDGLPTELVNEVEAWVRFRGFDYYALYEKSNRYRQERQVTSADVPVHLVFQIKSDEQDAENVYVSIWVIGDRDGYDPLEPPQPRVRDHRIAFTELPIFLEQWLQQKSNLDTPMIHCFVARHLLGYELDTHPIDDNGLTLGSQYKLVMRTDLSQSPTGPQYYTRWNNKWKLLEKKLRSPARGTFVRSDCCSNKKQLLTQLRSAEMAILENLSQDRVGEVFQFLADKVALPVALWVRQNELYEELDRILDCTVCDLPERVLQERLAAVSETCLGSHLSLVWEDPKIIPPTMSEFSQMSQ
jgi:V8-like Glu-specific endopeptidase